MSKIHVTLKDIARVAGVSTATASLALSGDPRVNVKTKRAVEEVAKRLNYVPNEIGRSLRAKKAETIAFIFPNTPHFAFSHPYFSQLLEGISEILVENSFHLMLSVSPSETDEAAAYDKILRNRRADGIILWPASIRDRNILKIVESGFPVVYLGRWHHDEIATVEREDVGGAYMATEHLIKQGRKRIVHLTGPLDYQVSIDRLEGYKRALQDNQLLFDPGMVIEKDFSMEGGAEAAKELLESGRSFDALFAANDRMAIGAMKALADSGISVPQDAAIVGYDNIEMASMMSPGLTTIDQPMKEIGKLAALKLMAMLNGEELQELQTKVPAQLIIRGSS
ncbi:LacI family DNA-binding transcriptional regulator [Cohnella sp. AR92]|uniref:LacI family DNA-binding transcriptional regulator n=1 Tax=Cohnella sp. AR92 TaxID=648716 RepID=UPI000F8E33BD|nr:LacI family DNA-binding transcriptional regulator [Cohnella sp. AR92]RUS46221.1 LacI family transcriptional regulator [Cohnella sp. AR92]